MTNEEAKSELFNLIISGEATKSNIALKMAIQALEQQSNTENTLNPCEWYDIPSNIMTLEQTRAEVKELREKTYELVEQKLDVETALHISQVDRDKWKARAVKLAKILGIRDCDIDGYEPKSNEFFNFDAPMIANISFDKDELQEIADELADEMRVKLDKCGDAVSRQEVKEKMQYYGFRAPDMTVSEFIEDLPPVTPVKIHGKWIHWTDDICDYVRCSKCDYGDEGEVKLGEETSFCPVCGSDNSEVSE